MTLHIPTITGTTCPTTDALRAPENRWAIVYSSGGRGYVGRLVDGDDSGSVKLADPFDYASARKLVRGDDGRARVAIERMLFPVEHFDVDEIIVVVDAIVPLSKVSPKQVDSLRADLIAAWEGREHLRKHGGRVDIAGANTRIEPASP